MDIVFTPEAGPQECFPVIIVDDDILEDTEFFLLSILPTNDSAVVLHNRVLNVGIENDDSKPVTLYRASFISNYLTTRCDGIF